RPPAATAARAWSRSSAARPVTGWSIPPPPTATPGSPPAGARTWRWCRRGGPRWAAAGSWVPNTAAPPPPSTVRSAGPGAVLIDTNNSLLNRLPLALGAIVVVTIVLLFLMFGSVVLPLKAVVLNLLSLSATFGAMVWIFQEGHLSGLLNFTATGGISASM